MTFCSETGGSSGLGLDNTGAFGFLTFGGSVVNYSSSITSVSNSSIYAGDDYYVFPATVGINAVFPSATGFIGFFDSTPPPPAHAFEWFLCNDDASCGAPQMACQQAMLEVTSVPDSIRLVGIEGGFETVNDLINAFNGNTGCPDLTVYPLPCGVPLPVKLSNFNGTYKAGRTSLTWSTYSELNNNYFTIEVSENGINFQELGIIFGSGNSSTPVNYEWIDENTFYEISYYRLKQTDYNGDSQYLGTISVRRTKEDLIISPNPTTGIFSLFVNDSSEGNLKILNSIGKVISKHIYKDTRVYNLNLAGPPGLYYLQFESEGQVITKKLVLN
jgi:hypothetical protein